MGRHRRQRFRNEIKSAYDTAAGDDAHAGNGDKKAENRVRHRRMNAMFDKPNYISMFLSLIQACAPVERLHFRVYCKDIARKSLKARRSKEKSKRVRQQRETCDFDRLPRRRRRHRPGCRHHTRLLARADGQPCEAGLSGSDVDVFEGSVDLLGAVDELSDEATPLIHAAPSSSHVAPSLSHAAQPAPGPSSHLPAWFN